jgi:Fic family protein
LLNGLKSTSIHFQAVFKAPNRPEIRQSINILESITRWFILHGMNIDVLTEKKRVLDEHRPLQEPLVRNLEEWYRVELTYTSNAIEGNTLTRRETALVVEKGLTVGGKTLIEHLEATNHAGALDWIATQVTRSPHDLDTKDILHIHRLILKGIDDDNAGRYRRIPVRISGSPVVLPNYLKVPDLMDVFCKWLGVEQQLHPVELAAEAHYRLVTIHPFVDGNGRSARLLMNLILIMLGYPPALIRKRDRLAYITALEKAQLGGSKADYLKLIISAVNRSLDIYLKAVLNEDLEAQAAPVKNLRIGELAKLVGESNSTIRHWTKEGLLEIADVTDAGYQLYAPATVARIEQIKDLKKKRHTLKEIKDLL